MKTAVKTFIQKNQLFHRGATVLVGVSGGPDSMALLHLLANVREHWNLRLIALTVDHGLRGKESHQDAEYVKKACATWNIECIETFLDVPSYKEKHGLGTQIAAREMRYTFFEKKMKEFQADYLALGHHADDQAETIIMRLVRNTNPSALAGMKAKRKFSTGFVVRPLFEIAKQEIEEYLKNNGIQPRRDPSNLEDNYTRNYVRLHVMPHLKALNPKLNRHLQRLSENWAEDEKYLMKLAEEVVEKATRFEGNMDSVTIQTNEFSAFPYALQRRAFHLILTYLYRDIPKSIDYIHEDQFFDLLNSQNPNASMDFPAGLTLIKAYQELKIRFSKPQSASFYYQLNIPGQLDLPDGSRVAASFERFPVPDSRHAFLFSTADIELPLFVRTRKPGDRMSLKGMQGTKKLKDIFIDEKIPKQDRNNWPVVTDNQDRIIWLPGLKKAAIKQKRESAEFIKLVYNKNGDI